MRTYSGGTLSTAIRNESLRHLRFAFGAANVYFDHTMTAASIRPALLSLIGLLAASVACGACSTSRGPSSKPDQCEPGYAAITRDDAQHAPMTICLAGPDYCKTNSDCASGYACEKNTGTSAPKGSGVCMPDTLAVLQKIE